MKIILWVLVLIQMPQHLLSNSYNQRHYVTDYLAPFVTLITNRLASLAFYSACQPITFIFSVPTQHLYPSVLFFLGAFSGHTRGTWRFPGWGLNRSCCCRPTPLPQQRQIRATSDLHHSSRQHLILNPLSEARNRTRNLMVPSRIRQPLSHDGNSDFGYFNWVSESRLRARFPDSLARYIPNPGFPIVYLQEAHEFPFLLKFAEIQ